MAIAFILVNRLTKEEAKMDKVRVLTKAANILDLMTKDLMVWDPVMRDMLEEVVADLREMRADLLDRGDLLQHNE